RDLWVHDEMQQALDRTGGGLVERGGRRDELHGARGRGDRAAVDLAEQIVHVVRGDVHDLQAYRLVRADADALADGVLGPLLVVTARFRDVHDMRDRVVLGLEAQIALDVATR